MWNKLHGFRATKNLAFDVMHDILEGVCVYNMGHIIHYLVNVRHFIDSFAVLNARIQGFNFSLDEEGDRPPIIYEFKKPSDFPAMKASEMCFFRNFAFMIGDLVPICDEFLATVQLINDPDLIKTPPPPPSPLLLLLALLLDITQLTISPPP